MYWLDLEDCVECDVESHIHESLFWRTGWTIGVPKISRERQGVGQHCIMNRGSADGFGGIYKCEEKQSKIISLRYQRTLTKYAWNANKD